MRATGYLDIVTIYRKISDEIKKCCVCCVRCVFADFTLFIYTPMCSTTQQRNSRCVKNYAIYRRLHTMCSIHTVFEIHFSFQILKNNSDVPRTRCTSFKNCYVWYTVHDLSFIKTRTSEQSIFHLNLKNDVFGVFDVFTYGVKPFSDTY